MPVYTVPAGNAVDFVLQEYTAPAGNTVDFEFGEILPEITPIPSTPVSSGKRVRLENIYAAIDGHVAPKAGRSEYWLLAKIGELIGIDLTSGYKSEETHLMNLYQNLTGTPYTGSRSSELILRAIEEAL